MAQNSETVSKLVLLQALQSMTNLWPLLRLLAIGPIPVTFVSNFWCPLAPPDSKLAYSSSTLCKSPLLHIYRDSTFRVPPLVILDLIGRFSCFRLQSLKASQHLRLIWGWIVNPTPSPQSGGPVYVSLFIWFITFDQSGMGHASRRYATVGIALRPMLPHKPHHKVKVGKVSINMGPKMLWYRTRAVRICFQQQ
jgi:hypothetical protein